jgi:hypothetical protein
MLERESKFFEERLPQLILTDKGRFVLIKGEQVIGTYAAVEDALRSGYAQFRDSPFFVRQVLPTAHPLSFSNHFFRSEH